MLKSEFFVSLPMTIVNRHFPSAFSDIRYHKVFYECDRNADNVEKLTLCPPAILVSLS
jgi:hypothetical protein